MLKGYSASLFIPPLRGSNSYDPQYARGAKVTVRVKSLFSQFCPFHPGDLLSLAYCPCSVYLIAYHSGIVPAQFGQLFILGKCTESLITHTPQ